MTIEKTRDLNTIKECFEVILNSDKENSRLAAREVRKILYGSKNNKNKYKDIKVIMKNAPETYAGISENWREENFVMAISVIHFLRDRKENPDSLFPWLFELLKHPNGKVRYAAVKMFENELGPLTVHIRFPNDKYRQSKAKRSNEILKALVISLQGLLNILWEEKYEKYEYIRDLPASPYKSVQMVFGSIEEYCGRKY
ncbi:MAG: hypothetical protein GF335_04940 [Candidatus Moranbacteria bacterium]|nr:hypothetical protein [Candidatus Moranbacteria bacterium]